MSIINKRSLIALSVGIFVGFYLFSALLIMQFITDFIATMYFMFETDLANRLINCGIGTAITILLITLINPRIIFNKKEKEIST